MYCRRGSNYQEQRMGIPLISLTLPHDCACSKPTPGFPKSCCVFFCMFNEVVVRFVDIGGIVDHLFLNFLFMIEKYTLHTQKHIYM
jgi:hypothetical protein